MNNLKDRLSFLMEGANVVRYHCRPGLRPNTVGHHSHNVAMLVYILTGGKASADLLMACNVHDLAEQVVSDVSAPAKRLLKIREALQNQENIVLEYFGFIIHLNSVESRDLHMADLFEMLLYCCDEAALGNKYVRLIMTRACFYINTELRLTALEHDVYEAILEIYKENIADGPTFDCYK